MAFDILVSLGYEVLLAPNGTDGLKIYQDNKNKISVVLLDLIMPKMDGIACYEKLNLLNLMLKLL